MSMFGLLSMCGVLSWLGILSRSYFSSFSLKLLICYAFSVPLFVCGLNLLNLVKYMPKTKGARRVLEFDFVLNQCWVGVQING
jgi:MFS-type transporter involved in bile tolerance (Atg22 family)